MRDKSQKPELEPGTYKHFKGGEYEVLEIIPDWSEGCEDDWKVLYRTALGELGVKKYEEFIEPKFLDGETIERYKKIEQEP